MAAGVGLRQPAYRSCFLNNRPPSVVFNGNEQFSIRDYVSGSAKAEITKKIEDIMGLCAGIQSIHGSVIHLLRACKWTIAIPDDIEVSIVEVGCEPDVRHRSDYVRIDRMSGSHAGFVVSCSRTA